MKKIILALILMLSFESFASLSGAESKLRKYKGLSRTQKVSLELVSSGYYYTAIPWVKEFLFKNRGSINSSMERAIDKLITVVGARQFEIMSIKYLRRSKSNSVRYIIAKKLIRKNKAAAALEYVNKINPNHPVYPFALNLKAVAYSLQGKISSSVSAFKNCEIASLSRLSKTSQPILKKQLMMNKDYCIMGEARALFQGKKFSKANLRYLDIPKSSFVWPEVLFEEAWNSYYEKNYNRTLGKLVTYNAPLFGYIFNPEIEVLTALTFMKMCLYKDAKKISDNFYKENMSNTRKLRLFLKRNARRYKVFYRLVLDFEKTKRASNPLLKRFLKSVVREPAYLEIRQSLVDAVAELKKVHSGRRRLIRTVAKKNLAEVIKTQKRLLGTYARQRLIEKYAQMYKAFEGMSYIKLETLAQRKARLYNFDDKGSKRGDIKYIQRNDKQYFWNFNGEFWADELGDYVFALGSEC